MRTAVSLIALVTALAAAPALAQPASDARFATTTLDLTGHGEARVPPDMATIELGVGFQASSPATALAGDAAAMVKVIAALRAGGVEARDIQTSVIDVTPQYAYAAGQAPRVTGYLAANHVSVTVGDLTRLGPDIDAVVAAGATNLDAVRFGLKTPGSAENFARLAAVKDLDDKAQVLADAAGYHIRRLVNLTETSAVQPGGPPNADMMAAMSTRAVATPVETGQIVVSVDVSGEFELTH